MCPPCRPVEQFVASSQRVDPQSRDEGVSTEHCVVTQKFFFMSVSLFRKLVFCFSSWLVTRVTVDTTPFEFRIPISTVFSKGNFLSTSFVWEA